MKKTIATPFIAVLLACLMLVGCTANQVTTTLEGIVDAASIAAPIATNLAGLPPDASATIVAYLGTVNTAVAQTGAELNSGDSNAVKSVKIVGYFTDAGLQLGPNLPAGTPTLAVQLVSAVAKSVANFLLQFQTPAAGTLKASKVKVDFDKKALDRIMVKNSKNATLLVKKK